MKEVSKSQLRRERERRGWSRSYVAEKTESDPRTVGRWERGDKLPNSYHLQLLCELFGMLPHELGLLRDDEVDNQERKPFPLSTDTEQPQTESPVLSSPSEPQVACLETLEQSAEPPVHPDLSEQQQENSMSSSFATIPPTHNETHIFSSEFLAGSMTSPITIAVHAIPKGHTLLRRIIMGGMAVLLVTTFIFGFLKLYPKLRVSGGSQSVTASCQEPSHISINSAFSSSLPACLTTSNIGFISFVSSGHFTVNSNQGMDDEVQIMLHHIPAPTPNKSYYAWLSGDSSQSEMDWLPLGELTFSNGNASLLYSGDQQHTNLLAGYSHLRITEESTQISPIQPSSDPSTWKYHAEISQVPGSTDPHHYSLLSHLRHLLSADPEINQMGLKGGLDFWFSWDMHEIVTLATSAADDWNMKNMLAAHNQFIRMLDYLDGRYAIQKDVPSGTPMLVDPSLVPVGLLYGTPQQQPPGYLTHIEIHIGGVSLASGATTGQKTLASLLQIGMNSLSNWLRRVRLDAKQLASMNNMQLSQQTTHSLLQDMETQVQYAYNGQTGPADGNILNGANWIYTNIQYLATIDMKAY